MADPRRSNLNHYPPWSQLPTHSTIPHQQGQQQPRGATNQNLQIPRQPVIAGTQHLSPPPSSSAYRQRTPQPRPTLGQGAQSAQHLPPNNIAQASRTSLQSGSGPGGTIHPTSQTPVRQPQTHVIPSQNASGVRQTSPLARQQPYTYHPRGGATTNSRGQQRGASSVRQGSPLQPVQSPSQQPSQRPPQQQTTRPAQPNRSQPTTTQARVSTSPASSRPRQGSTDSNHGNRTQQTRAASGPVWDHTHGKRSQQETSPPGSDHWLLYTIDDRGTKRIKTKPPPQGTYKASDGLGRIDYSDPRDFLAESKVDQYHVWTALGPTRQRYFNITGVNFEQEDMLDLEMGYNAAWAEVKRKLTAWIFAGHDPDHPKQYTSVVAESIEDYIEPSQELGGYGTIGTRVARQDVQAANYNPRRLKFFNDKNELIFNFEEHLLKLGRWYGLVKDYQWAPNWPHDRARDTIGKVAQNPEIRACSKCIGNNVLCYGHKENPNQRCTPCLKIGITCSKERAPGKEQVETIVTIDQLGKRKYAEEMPTDYLDGVAMAVPAWRKAWL